MKIRDSGMPDEKMWSAFFDPATILSLLGLTSDTKYVVDMGCGYGTFAISAAQITRGTVYAVDIEVEMVTLCQQKAQALGIPNLRTIQRDFMRDGTGLPDQSVDYCMLFNILHAAQPMHLLHEAHRILRPGGKVAVLHWNYDPTTPRGPAMDIRPTPEQCVTWLQTASFTIPEPVIDLPPYHYGIVGVKVWTGR